ERFPRVATLPFDPVYKLMAVFTDASDDHGSKVVRCFVKGAAPAVMSHATTALAAGTSVPFDEAAQKVAQTEIDRMGALGLRVMAAATKDLDPASFDA